MPNNDVVRARISAQIEDIEAIPADVRKAYAQPEDREAFDIVARLERKIKAAMGNKQPA